MSAIDREGLYLAVIKDFAVGVTRRAELPQFVVTVQATHVYNEATEDWDAWDYEQTLTGYFVLMSLNEQGIPIKCLNYDQVMEATGWDGETFSSLNAMDLKETSVQIRVAEDTFEGKTTLKMNWIAAKDASIGLRKLTDKDVTDLDKKFGVHKNKAATPSTAKKATPAKKSAAPKPPKPPKAKATETTPEVAVTPCTEDEAFQACLTANAAQEKSVPDNILNDYWLTHVEEIAADTDNVTDDEYGQIQVAVIKDIEIPF